MPRTPVEEMLCNVWAGVLRLDRVGLEDDFFELGGHSLLAMQLIPRVREILGMKLPVSAFLDRRTISGLLKWVQESQKKNSAQGITEPPALTALGAQLHAPLSFAQQRLWFMDQLEPGSAAYNVPGAIRMNGVLDKRALQLSLDEIVKRHQILRTRFVIEHGSPIQKVGSENSVAITRLDLDGLAAAELERKVEQLGREEAQRPFD